MKKTLYLLPCLLCFFLLNQQTASAQTARLGIQGILKKANGNAVDDGAYSLRFRLYTQAEGGAHIWEETQPDVEVVGGIYTATLGSVAPLNVPFNTTYYLGVAVGSTSEMLPRIQLTTAPYALALIGNTNQFPSSGLVQADSTIIKGRLAVGQTTLEPLPTLQVAGGVVARGGAPGLNGASNNGYAFSGNSGDNDSGLFSTADGRVSLYANNTERLRATTTGVEITGNLTSNTTTLTVDDNLNLTSGKSVQYNGISDWRLVDTDIFSNGNKQGWESTTGLFNTTAGTTTLENFGNNFHGWALRPNNESDWLKKEFTLDPAVVGPYTQVKVKFKYFFLDSWDAEGSQGTDLGLGGFSTNKEGSTLAFAWSQLGSVYGDGGGLANLNFYNGSGSYTDAATIGEMTMTRRNGTDTSFWVFFGAKMAGTDDENYAIGDIEVWVR